MTTNTHESTNTTVTDRQPTSNRRAGLTRWQFPIGTYLIALVLVVVVPTFLFSAIVLVRTTEAQNKSFQDLFIASTHSVTQLVDREISGMLASLRVLSSEPSLRRNDLPQFHRRASTAVAGSGAYLSLLDKDADEMVNTRVPFGNALGTTSDPQSVRDAMKSGWPVVSPLHFDAVGKKWVFNVVMPLKSEAGEAGSLVLTQSAASFDDILSSKRIPKGWNAVLVDSTRTVIASSEENGSTGRQFYIPFDKGLSSGFTETRFQGVDYQLVVQPSDVSGWSIVSWAPTDAVRRTVNQSLIWLVAGGIAIAVFAGLGAFLIARSVSASVRELAGDARRLGKGEIVGRREEAIAEFETVSQALADAARNRKAAENEIRFLMREVAHRSKNQLTVIQAMLNQTAKLPGSKQEFAESFHRRIAGLARSTDLMMSNATQGVELRVLVADQIETFRPAAPERVSIEGPDVRLDSQAAQVMGMAIHELATNATKYGAFSGPEGRLDVNWSLAGEAVKFVWREHDVPGVEEPERKGFGSIVLERILGISLGAELHRTIHADGIEWNFSIPLEKLNASFDA